MKFTPQQQNEFDTLLGQAANALHDGQHIQAQAYLDTAHQRLVSRQIHDDYDWSGWYDLKMEVLMAQGAIEEAAETARQMLENVAPEPSDFSTAHHRIIQDSLINATRVLGQYLITQDRAEHNQDELRRTLETGITMTYRQEREDALQALQQQYAQAFSAPYSIPDEDAEP